MRIRWTATLLIVGATAIWACSGDDDASNGTSSPANDAGIDAFAYTPPEPPSPLDCAVTGTFDPCDAGIDPTVFYAAINDAGVDASSLSDAGVQPSTSCVASGAVRIACDGGPFATRFDLAPSDDSSLAVAYTEDHGSRFTIASDGGIATMTALAGNSDGVRIVANGGTVATISAASGTDRFTLLRDNVPKDLGNGDVQKHINDAPPILGAAAGDDGTVYTLLSNGAFQRLAPNAQTFDTKFQNVGAGYLGWGPHGSVILMSRSTSGFGLYNPELTSAMLYPTNGSAFAVGRGIKGEALVAIWGPAEDEIQIAAVRDVDQSDYLHWTIQRDPPCGLDQTGCGYVCTEKVRQLSPSGQFVATADATYFVQLEAHVTRTRTYSADFGVVCGIFGGCPCGSEAVPTSFDGLDVVALQIDVDKGTITERARARVELGDPQKALFTTHSDSGNDVIAVGKGSQIHVGIQGGGSEMARIVMDLKN